MFGSLRLILAAMVVFSHVGANIGGVWLGVIAVVIFFMLSGYAMTALMNSRFPDLRDFYLFYLERFVRLAPQYYLWIALSLVGIFILNWATLNTADWIPYGLLCYLSVLPMGLQRYFAPVNTLLMPQATSLGIECCLYVFTPILLKSRHAAIGGSLLGLALYAATE